MCAVPAASSGTPATWITPSTSSPATPTTTPAAMTSAASSNAVSVAAAPIRTLMPCSADNSDGSA